MPQYFIEQRISERISETPQGFLLCQEVPIARTGKQEYLAREIGLNELAPNTVVSVDRLEADVMAPEVLASFEGVTVTLGHPNNQVTADNWRAISMGHLQNIRRGENDQSHLILADMLITDPATILQVKGGLREVSCGYDCQYVQDDDGNWRQTQIRGNHVAIVPRGRAGPECSIKDSIMSKLADKVRSIWARATDEAAAAVLEGEAAATAATTATPPAVAAVAPAADAVPPKGVTVDAKTGKVTVAADADISGIVADLMERLSYMERCKAETDAMVEGLKAAIEKLKDGDEPTATDAAKVAADAAKPGPKPVTDQLTIARAEILAPGIELVEGVELAALLKAYATDAGKQVINLFTGGQAPTADNAAAAFAGAAEVLKAQRASALTPQNKTADAQAADAIARINTASKTLHPLF